MPESFQQFREALGQRLAALRKARGLTQDDMGKAGINPRYYARVERGEVNVSFEKLIAIARMLDAPLANLFSIPLFSKRVSKNVDGLLAALVPLIGSGDEELVASLTRIIQEFSSAHRTPVLKAAQKRIP